MSQDAQCSFDPRVAPRDAGDAAISLAIGTCQILILFGLPGALVHALSASTTLTETSPPTSISNAPTIQAPIRTTPARDKPRRVLYRKAPYLVAFRGRHDRS